VTLALLLAPVWLIVLCAVTGLCAAARAGDHQGDSNVPLVEHPQDDVLAQPEWVEEQVTARAPAVIGDRRAA
jgi:hypothetical protein